jgi:1,4-dihydroxy-2-naphthoate octaprenyltransferase
MYLRTVIQTFRPPFIVLSPVCVLLGLSVSLTTATSINYFLFFLVLVGATAAHISVNTLNEFYDFKSGLDLKTDKTPFSGGSGALPDNPEAAKSVLITGVISLLITITIGIYLCFISGIEILPIGLIGVAIIITYTQWINRLPFLCLIAPGLGFGVLMVVGTHVILTGHHFLSPWLISLIPFFLINNLLLLNQYPDVKADASIGRETFPIRYGFEKSNITYTGFMATAYILIPLYVTMGYIPTLSLIALIPVGLSLFALFGANKYSSKISNHPKFLAANVAAAILTPLLLAISIILD